MHRFLQILQRLRSHHGIAVGLCLAVGTAVLMDASPAQGQVPIQHENTLLTTTVTSVETSPGANGWRYLSVAVHFHNRTKKPLILGVEPSKVSSTDDRRNTYGVLMVRGLGEVAGSRVDPKFVLSPEGGGDALFEMRWRGDRTAIFGTVFDLKLPVRVILPLEAGQYKLGAEHLLNFSGLKSGHVAKMKQTPALPENTVNAGLFTMQITRMTPSYTGNRRIHSAVMTARIQNTSDNPLVLAYEGSSSYGIDDQGNRYAFGTAGTHDTSVSGIGLSTGRSADPQFTLAPGEAREAQFTLIRRVGREVAGTLLTYHVALVQLEVLPGDQIRTVRQYSLSFPRMSGLNE